MPQEVIDYYTTRTCGIGSQLLWSGSFSYSLKSFRGTLMHK